MHPKNLKSTRYSSHPTLWICIPRKINRKHFLTFVGFIDSSPSQDFYKGSWSVLICCPSWCQTSGLTNIPAWNYQVVGSRIMFSGSTDSSSIIFLYLSSTAYPTVCNPSDEHIVTPACFSPQSDIHIWVKKLFNLENFEVFTFLVKCISKKNCIILTPFKVSSSGK